MLTPRRIMAGSIAPSVARPDRLNESATEAHGEGGGAGGRHRWAGGEPPGPPRRWGGGGQGRCHSPEGRRLGPPAGGRPPPPDRPGGPDRAPDRVPAPGRRGT